MSLNIFQTSDLELRINNPYSLSNFYTYSPQERELEGFYIRYNKSSKDRYYQVDDGNSYSDISFLAYGDSKFWWVIFLVNYNINPDLMNPFDLPIGTYLLIPDLETFRLQNNGQTTGNTNS